MVWCDLDSGHGRLGNQLFRFAATVGVADECGVEPRFPDDWRYRPWFRVPDRWWVPRSSLDGPQTWETERCSHLGVWAPYMQDLGLWERSVGAVRRALRWSPLAAEQIAGWRHDCGLDVLPRPWVMLHVRRGDNVTNEWGTINALPESYYRDAVAKLRARGHHGRVVCVTDDPAWCLERLGDLADRVVSSGAAPKELDDRYGTHEARDWLDLAVLGTPGTRHVLSNSTFAWWGAFLAGDSMPVRPSYWVGDQLIDAGFDPSLILPDRWLVIPTHPC